ncbi:MAG: hypothetical protein ABR511_13780 [Acidimicrobiales bacterium]
MSLPPLYVEGLMQRGGGGLLELDTYKLGLVEALLKQALRQLDDEAPADRLHDTLRAALDVTLWEAPDPWRAPGR